MQELQITIQGTTPLLLHRFTDEAQMIATAGSRPSIANDAKSPQEQAEESLYLDENGVSGIPGPNVMRCLIDAGKYLKVGRTKATTQKSSLIPAAISIEELFLPISSTSDWKVDTRPVRIPTTGGRISRHRPCYDDWGLSFHLQLDESVLTAKMLREILDLAGSRIGLGDFRPDCKGPFGKFKVTEWRNGNGNNA